MDFPYTFHSHSLLKSIKKLPSKALAPDLSLLLTKPREATRNFELLLQKNIRQKADTAFLNTTLCFVDSSSGVGSIAGNQDEP